MNTTAKALQCFVRACNREARFAAYCGQKKYAVALRSSASSAITEYRATRPAPAPIDAAAADRRQKALMHANLIAITGGRRP